MNMTRKPGTYTFTADKTFDELFEAYNSGVMPIAHLDDQWYNLSGYSSHSGKKCMYFTCLTPMNSTDRDLYLERIMYSEDGKIRYNHNTITSEVIYEPRPLLYFINKSDGEKIDKYDITQDKYIELPDDQYITDLVAPQLTWNNMRDKPFYEEGVVLDDTHFTLTDDMAEFPIQSPVRVTAGSGG